MKPALLVAVSNGDAEIWAGRMRDLLPDRDVLAIDRDGTVAAAESVLAKIGYLLAWKPQPELFDRLPGLRAIFSIGAGVDHLFSLPRLPRVPIVRMVASDLTARMTEYVVWQVLHHQRLGSLYARQQRQRVWSDREPPAAGEVAVGIMGLGVLGSAAAAALIPLGFRLRSWTRSPRPMPGVEAFHGPGGLDAFLGGTDILVSLLPLTPETTGLLDAALIDRLRRPGPLGGPVLINAGRGGSQVEADIVAALQDGRLSGASLDVFATEPLPADSPLWGFDNVVITPHVAAVSDPAALAAGIAAGIESFESGAPLRNIVDPARGY